MLPLVRSSPEWRRLATDIRLHNLTVVTHPFRKKIGPGEIFLWAGVVPGLAFLEPAVGAFGMMVFIARLASDKNPAVQGAPSSVVEWRARHKIEPEAGPIPELPEQIPAFLFPLRHDYERLLQAARSADFDKDE
jgi:hypothetical protein